MKKKLYIAALALAAVLPAAAQDTYESARLLTDDLNGTARYVGMGGAMEALGADISTIATNPAGIGLFRHSTISASGGLVSQQDVKEFAGKNGTKMSFDQLGFVYSSRVSRRSFVNVGFNFHKSHNFNQILSAANSLRNVSQNMLSWHKADLGDIKYGGYCWDFNKDGDVMGYENENSPFRAQTYSQSDYLNMNALNLDEDEEGYLMNQNAADYYMFDRSHRGWIADYDFNVSGNQSDRFYWGVTVGIRDVKYKGFSIYTERLVNALNDNTGSDGNEDYVDYSNEYRLVNSAYLNINFTDRFSLRTDLGVDYQNNSRYMWLGNGTPFGLQQNGANAILTGSTFAYNAKAALHYEAASDQAAFKVDGGVEFLGGREKLGNMNGMDFFSHFLREKGINIMASKPESHRIDEKAFHYGFFLHPTLVLDKVIGMDVIFRADKTPKFDLDQFVLYPAATMFFDLREAFFRGSDIVDLLKVSGGYGFSGMERTVPFVALPDFSLTLPVQVVSGTEDFYNALERSRSGEVNLRVEAGFADQVRLSAAYYDKRTRERLDLYLFGTPMTLTPEYYIATTPSRAAICNEFTLENKGFEFDASFDIVKSGSFLWNLSANAAFNEYVHEAGQKRSFVRLLPRYFGGVGTTVSAGGFTLDAQGTFVGGNEILNLNLAAKDGVPEDMEPLYEKGDYFRLSRISLAYDLPVRTKWLQGVRVLLSGNNLLTVSKYSGWNPDVNCYGRQGAKFGVDYGSYPIARTFLLGVNVNF